MREHKSALCDVEEARVNEALRTLEQAVNELRDVLDNLFKGKEGESDGGS